MTVSEGFLKAFDRATAELESLRRHKALSQEQAKAYSEALNAFQSEVDGLEKIIESQAVQNTELAAALQAAKELVLKYDKELKRVRKQRDAALKKLVTVAAICLIAGFTLGRR